MGCRTRVALLRHADRLVAPGKSFEVATDPRAELKSFPKSGRSVRDVVSEIDRLRAISNISQADRRLTGEFARRSLDELEKVVDHALLAFNDSVLGFSNRGPERMEREVISMLGSLWNNKNGESAGMVTSGGTEANLTALYAAISRRDKEFSGKSGSRGSVVLSSAAHPSVFKALRWLGLRPVIVRCRANDFTLDARHVEKSIRTDTVAIVANCGVWPWGTVDPIPELGEIAEKRSLFLHVDAAWSGLLFPWLSKLGYDIPKFGFEAKGVSSISGSPDKMGFSIYPTGAIVFKDEKLFEPVHWSSGDYSTPGLPGTRAASLVATTWAIFEHLGEQGYKHLAKTCMDLTLETAREIERIEGLELPLEPMMNVLTFSSKSIDMSSVKSKLRKRGWHFFSMDGRKHTLQNNISIVLVPYHSKVIPDFLSDLKRIVRDCR